MKEIKKRLRGFDLFELSIIDVALHNVDSQWYFLNEDRFFDLRNYISSCHSKMRKDFLDNL